MKIKAVQQQLNSIWDENPSGYATLRECWLNRRRAKFVCEYIEARGNPNTHKILEVGSGAGNLLFALSKQFPHVTFIGAEPNATYVDYCNDKVKLLKINNLKFVRSYAENISENISNFRPDVILTNDCLHHVVDLTKVIHELKAISNSESRWLAIEPNANNPYVFLRQATGQGEKNFFLNQFKKISRSQWKIRRNGYIFIIPPFIKAPPNILIELEKRLEGNRLLSGGVYVELEVL